MSAAKQPSRSMPQSEPPLLPIGALFGGKYRVLTHLGTGGMAQVFQVECEGEIRALKVLKPQFSNNAAIVANFVSEAKIMRRLRHRNIIRVYESAQVESLHCFVMEFVDGWTAKDRITHGLNTPMLEVLRSTFELLQAVGAAHLGGVIHRDIKPSNLLLSLEGTKLSDFGIAHSAYRAQPGPQGPMGTEGFMAPEQQKGSHKISTQTDLYAVGATLYAMLARRDPCGLIDCPMDCEQLDKIVPPVRPIIQRATRSNPRDRYKNAREMALALALARDQVAADWGEPRVADEWMEEFDRYARPQPAPRVSQDQRPVAPPSEAPSPTLYALLGLCVVGALLTLIALLIHFSA